MSHFLCCRAVYKTQRKSYTCPRYLTKYYTEEKFQKHKEIREFLNKVQRVKYPIGKNNKSKKISFEQYKNMWPFPFILYADFESSLRAIEDVDVHGKLKSIESIFQPVMHSMWHQLIHDGNKRLIVIWDLIV